MALGIMILLTILFGPLVGLFMVNGRVKRQEARIKALEDALEKLTQSENQVQAVYEETTTAPVVVAPTEPKVTEAVASHETRVEEKPKVLREKKDSALVQWLKRNMTIESIISNLGIGMLLIGIGYIFRLAYDQGYITEEMAVLLGGLAGGVLMYLGTLAARRGRIILRQVLWGGGIATFYISVFAAYQGYGLIGGFTAFSLMCLVTGAGFILALLTNSLTMSVTAVLGGLLTPFVLQLEQLGLMGTGIYLLVMSVFAMIVYVFKRWRILQVVSVLGVYMVTTYFISIEPMAFRDEVNLAILMTLLMLLFTGVEYGLAFVGKASSRFPAITYGLLAGLPLITAGQVWATLMLTDQQWMAVFAGAAVVYIAMTIIYFVKEKDWMILAITVGLTGVFLLLAVVTGVQGDIRPVALAGIALIYYGLSMRLNNKAMKWVAHGMFLGAFMYAFSKDVLDMIDGTYMDGLTSLYAKLIISAMFLVVVAVNRGYERLVAGVIAVECYMMPMLLLEMADFMEGLDTIYLGTVLILLYVLMVWGLMVFNGWQQIVPHWSLIVLTSIMVITAFLSSMTRMIFELDAFRITETLSWGLGALGILLTGRRFLGTMSAIGQRILRTIIYLLIYSLLLIDLSVMAEGFAFGLIAMAGIMFSLNFRDIYRDGQWMKNLLMGTRILWFIMVFIYTTTTLGRPEFQWQLFAADMGLLVMVYYHLRYFRFELKPYIIAGVVGLLLLALSYGRLSDHNQGSGITTLIWAAWSVGLLGYSVWKSERRKMNLSMAFIIIVAIKIVMVDLANQTTLWKIVVSMAFGTALLALSYVLQPLFKRREEIESTDH